MLSGDYLWLYISVWRIGDDWWYAEIWEIQTMLIGYSLNVAWIFVLKNNFFLSLIFCISEKNVKINYLFRTGGKCVWTKEIWKMHVKWNKHLLQLLVVFIGKITRNHKKFKIQAKKCLLLLLLTFSVHGANLLYTTQ